VEGGEQVRVYDKSDAVLHVCEALMLLPLGFVRLGMQQATRSMRVTTHVWTGKALPKSLRHSLYDVVAINRYNLMGKRECRLEAGDPRYADRFIS
jgi:predicted DCC family thiol-disulfide oxidoreductase YuxK